MTETEKKAIETVKLFLSWDNKKFPPKTECEALETVLNLIQRQEKTIQSQEIIILDNIKKITELKNKLKEG